MCAAGSPRAAVVERKVLSLRGDLAAAPPCTRRRKPTTCRGGSVRRTCRLHLKRFAQGGTCFLESRLYTRFRKCFSRIALAENPLSSCDGQSPSATRPRLSGIRPAPLVRDIQHSQPHAAARHASGPRTFP